jgi:hypothetical protein
MMPRGFRALLPARIRAVPDRSPGEADALMGFRPLQSIPRALWKRPPASFPHALSKPPLRREDNRRSRAFANARVGSPSRACQLS